MTFKQVEFIFNRALRFSFSKKKLLLTFPIIALCGLLIVFCRALAIGASHWVVMSLTFLPFFLCSSLLLSLGVLLSRIYYNEVKQLHGSYRSIFAKTWELIVNISYVSLPLLLLYLFLWILLGVFYLLRQLPAIGDFFGVIFAFGPFLLVLGSIVLSITTVLALFFATPHVAFRLAPKKKNINELIERFTSSFFSSVLLFLIALLPLVFVVALLLIAASITGAAFAVNSHPVALVLQWFFIMIPFCGIVTPGVIFFFNFSVESFALLEKRQAIEMDA